MALPAQRLRAVKSFEEIVRYLEDELDWPLQEYDFDELTFEYLPEELGLKEEEVAKVRRIHQLRPLQYGQPWGIFFVEFEAKKLPVVVLRRILSHLVVKKRAGANRANAAAWDASDLLFISAFGEEESDQREVAFAHFHQSAGDLPTLRVLGWDGADTPLKLQRVAATLQEKLHWPDDPTDADAWRNRWAGAFQHRLGHVIRTADALAERLAGLARNIRAAALDLLAVESETGRLRSLHSAFQTALIHDLSEENFADTYAQTITYGLLTAAISRTDPSGGREDTTLYSGMLPDVVPVTNPFLKEMLQTFLQAGGRQGGIDFDELGIQDVVALLRGNETDLPAILRDFGNKTQGEDPVIHFYEHFLAAYDKQLKVQRGVFYTPQPVVSYIVRSVHELLQSEFGLTDGLADTTTWGEMAARLPDLTIPEGTNPESPFVVILDPATGTATFLVEVIDVIYRALTEKWQAQRLSASQRQAAWNEYVPRHLLPRLYGYELMMAPYAIAHMKIGLKLHETGYRFASEERVRVYLTNALEPADDAQMQMAGILPALAHEAQAVNGVKRGQRFMVVVGNPPYSGHSANKGEWIGQKLRDYYKVDGKPLGEHNTKWLQDDYVKFIRLGQETLLHTNIGVLGFITNHGYIDNPTFRGMRTSLLRDFKRMWICDLHGNTKKREKDSAGRNDENVFDIQQGVAIVVASLGRGNTEAISRVRHLHIRGERSNKLAVLSAHTILSTDSESIFPAAPFYLFAPQDAESSTEYQTLISVVEESKQSSLGILTKRDSLTISFSSGELIDALQRFANPLRTDTEVAIEFGVPIADNDRWNLSQARGEIQEVDIDCIRRMLYRPFDYRFVYYHDTLVARTNRRVLTHMDDQMHRNYAFILGRQGMATGAGSWDVCFVCAGIADQNVYRRGGGTIVPLYLLSKQYLRQIRRIKRWVNRILESFSGEIPTIHTTYDRNHRTAYLF